jgi:prophage regulatory protein
MKISNTPGPVMISLTDVMAITSLGKSTIYSEMQKGRFPKQVRISKRRSAWIQEKILGYNQARIDESDNQFKGV